MRLLLINPRFPESWWSSQWALDRILPGKRAINPPLGLATLAALAPSGWDIQIVDENVEEIPATSDADIVGVCGMGVQFPRQLELLAEFRARGHYTIAGGSYASLCPEHYAGLADSVVAGEAERIFPQFCRDFESGAARSLYHETETVELCTSPVPRFDLLKLDRYHYTTLQFSRGCPFRCEFCDIIVMFGRKPRVKSLDQVGRELDALRALGMRNVFFVDDNLIGNLPMARKLMVYLADYQRRHGYRFHFGTEASLNLAQHEDLVAAMRSANFGWVFIGIESTDPASLKETMKTQNLHGDILSSIRRIYAHGIEVLAGFIVGFDNDTLDAFEHQYRFITEAGIQAAMVGLLTALPKTPLYERLKRAGRLLTLDDVNDAARPATNIVPLRMSYDAMIEAYADLYRRLFQDGEIARRIRNKLRFLAPPASYTGYGRRDSLVILWRLMRFGILPGGLPRLWHFARSLRLSPSQLSVALAEWITALSMRDFARRKLGAIPPPGALEARL